jgi:4-amino-4-deoxy-L-arabinose transferase-like glycosyltransferase
LFFLALAHAFTGFFGRDPWRGDDVVGLGIAHTMLLALQKGDVGHWLTPRLPAQALPEEGPLPFWVASLIGWVVHPTGFDLSLLLRTLWAFAWLGSLALVWLAVQRLSRRPELLAHDPLGIAARPDRLARALADCAVLLMLACLGLVERVHATSTEAMAMLIAAAATFALAWGLDSPRKAGWLSGALVAAACLTKGVAFALALAAAQLVLLIASPHWRSVAPTMGWRSLLAAALPLGLWLAALGEFPNSGADWLYGWWQHQLRAVFAVSGARWLELAVQPWWFFWPAWPIAAWALWQWRDRLREPAILAPVVLAGSFLVLAPASAEAVSASLMPVSIPVVVLAAMGLPTLRRGVTTLIDWYAFVVYGLIAVMFWAYFVAWVSGWPARMAYRMEFLARSSEPALLALTTILSAGATIAWLALARWRLARKEPAIWRPVVIASSGLVLVWFLYSTLFLEGHNARNSYREMSARILSAMRLAPQAEQQCVEVLRVSTSVQASLQWFADLRFSASAGCPWLLIQDGGASIREAASSIAGWQLVWVGARIGERQERFRLYLQSMSEAPGAADTQPAPAGNAGAGAEADR